MKPHRILPLAALLALTSCAQPAAKRTPFAGDPFTEMSPHSAVAGRFKVVYLTEAKLLKDPNGDWVGDNVLKEYPPTFLGGGTVIIRSGKGVLGVVGMSEGKRVVLTFQDLQISAERALCTGVALDPNFDVELPLGPASLVTGQAEGGTLVFPLGKGRVIAERGNTVVDGTGAARSIKTSVVLSFEGIAETPISTPGENKLLTQPAGLLNQMKQDAAGK